MHPEPDPVESVAAALLARGGTLACAESCTGGGLGRRLTALAGSSAWFLGGAITYSNALKRDWLGVPADLIEQRGAVSAEVAQAMAAGIRRSTGADWAVSVTGIAGPDGGRPNKPVGTVFIALEGPDRVAAVHPHRFAGDREAVREAAVHAALEHLARALHGR